LGVTPIQRGSNWLATAAGCGGAADELVALDDDTCGDGSADCCEPQSAATRVNAGETRMTTFTFISASYRLVHSHGLVF
jgi:hypothetical protein